MLDKSRLFPIGILAKLTGVHIRCLRYYEKLGILTPAYVDKDTGYRYYTYRQMRIIEAIQYCVELDIPLKKFSEFLSQEDGQIDYAALVAYGKQVTEEKMESIRKRQQFVEEMQNGIIHAEECLTKGRTVSDWNEMYYYCLPYEGTQTDIEFQSTMVKLINDLEANGFQAGYDSGILWISEDCRLKSYVFVNIKKSKKDLSHYPQIVKIPAGKYLCVTAERSGMTKDVFLDQIQNRRRTYIVETELFSGIFRYTKPTFELRCYLGE